MTQEERKYYIEEEGIDPEYLDYMEEDTPRRKRRVKRKWYITLINAVLNTIAYSIIFAYILTVIFLVICESESLLWLVLSKVQAGIMILAAMKVNDYLEIF